MKPSRPIVVMFGAMLVACALAQPSTSAELAHALQTDAMVADEPIGNEVDCTPYEELIPDMELSCFELYMPMSVMQSRFNSYIDDHEGFSWAGKWEDVTELPADLDPEDRHRQRTIDVEGGGTFLIRILDVGFSSHIVVGLHAE